MYAVLGEDRSDVEMLDALIRRIANAPNTQVYTKGYQGGPELLAKGALQLKTYSRIGVSRFVICYDSDRSPPLARYKEIIQKVVTPANVPGTFCALVPVQEIESWVLADIDAVSKVHTSWRASRRFSNPESINNPKELLVDMTKRHNLKPLYNHKTHNPQVAKHISLQRLATACPSSLALFELVQSGLGNHPNTQSESDSIRSNRIVTKLKRLGIN